MDDPGIAIAEDRVPRERFKNFPYLPVFALALLLAALAYPGYQALIAFGADDTNHLETPLVLATARQLADGPGTLYGPFSGKDPLVLIHAPLYYRLAGLMAAPIARTGVGSVTASLAAGRALACVGFLATLLAAWWIARLDGAAKSAGAVALLLIASSPVFGSFGFTVRPDTLGLALQTIGFGLVLKTLREGRDASRWPVLASGLAFGLASCVKQHLVVAAAVAGLLLIVSAWRGRTSRGAAFAGLLLGLLVPAAYYGWEEFVTGGRMSRSVFVLPSLLRETAGASWGHVATVFVEVAKRGVGEVAVALSIVFVGGRRAILGNRLDAALWLVLLAEVAAMVPLCLASEGAFVNYAMPAVVWASILIGRAFARLLEGPRFGWRGAAIALAGLVLLARGLQLVAVAEIARRDDRGVLAELLADPLVSATPADRRYFVHLPQHNRLHGRADLAHDEWLYGSYEAAGLAEPRSGWLRAAIAGRTPEGRAVPGALTMVIVPAEPPAPGVHVPGIAFSLPELGYRIYQQYGRYTVWVREAKGG